MGWVKDNTGRFLRRPSYQQSFLDRRCERLIITFLIRLYGRVTIPVPSGALIKLLEHATPLTWTSTPNCRKECWA